MSVDWIPANSRSAARFARWQRYKPQVLAALIGTLALVAMGGVVAEAGLSMPSPRSQQFFRFCNGKCVCDGGVANKGLMERICPEGWREAYSSAREKLIRRRERLRRERIRKLKQALPPPTPALEPSV